MKQKYLLVTTIVLILHSCLFIFHCSAQYTKLLDFTGPSNGREPEGDLISVDTFLYGMTKHGGTNDLGTIFKIKSDGTDYAKLLDFSGLNGTAPFGSLIFVDSFLYGMTSGGGATGGVIFKIKPDGSSYSKLLDFTDSINGSHPLGSLIYDGTFLYGMTMNGGLSNYGTIFKIKPDGSSYSKLLDFTGYVNGGKPKGSLIFDGTFLYGMTSDGGIHWDGTIFKIKTDGTDYFKLLDFADATNGRYPNGSLTTDGTFLYGMTIQGGAHGSGVIFKIMPDGTGFSDLHDFGFPSDAHYPHGSLILNGSFLYGMASAGGTGSCSSGCGVLFKIKPNGTGYNKLQDFIGTSNGRYPNGSLISDGTFLYGMTYEGGLSMNGVIFKYQLTPLLPISLLTQSIAAGGYYSLALCNNNTVDAWGNNSSYELGNGSNIASNTPVQVSSLSNIISIAAGAGHAYALKSDSTVWAWGYNQDGELGNGNNINSNVPVNVTSLSEIIAIAAGTTHSLALKNDGTVWACGKNTYGQLGNGTISNSNIPIQINSLTNIVAITAGFFHSLALKQDGTLWAWGRNNNGQLGNGSTMDSNIPIQINSLTDITAISGGGGHSLALKNDSTVWSWGMNNKGQLGNGSTINSNIPVQVNSLSGIIEIATGIGNHSLALKNNGTVMSWGLNTYGQLGNGINTDSHIPIQVSILTGITTIKAGSDHSLALKNDNTVWAWGHNNYGQLGDGTANDNNLPVQTIALCSTITQINETSKLATITIYPNPTDGIVNVQIENQRLLKIELFVYNIIGEKIYQSEFNNSKYAIDLYNQPNGIYFINLNTQQGIVSKKIIINK